RCLPLLTQYTYFTGVSPPPLENVTGALCTPMIRRCCRSPLTMGAATWSDAVLAALAGPAAANADKVTANAAASAVLCRKPIALLSPPARDRRYAARHTDSRGEARMVAASKHRFGRQTTDDSGRTRRTWPVPTNVNR